nr:MAG TPA: hypothetical protein [Caudoviricetes sp.]
MLQSPSGAFFQLQIYGFQFYSPTVQQILKQSLINCHLNIRKHHISLSPIL